MVDKANAEPSPVRSGVHKVNYVLFIDDLQNSLWVLSLGYAETQYNAHDHHGNKYQAFHNLGFLSRLLYLTHYKTSASYGSILHLTCKL